MMMVMIVRTSETRHNAEDALRKAEDGSGEQEECLTNINIGDRWTRGCIWNEVISKLTALKRLALQTKDTKRFDIDQFVT